MNVSGTDSRHMGDIQLMKDIGVKSSNFPIYWSIIEPQQGVYDENAIKHYHSLIDEHLKNNIEPMITLDYKISPMWLSDMHGSIKIGKYNVTSIAHFVKFTEFVFHKYSSKAKMWCIKYDISSFYYEEILDSFARIYDKLKITTNGREARIGLGIDILHRDPYNRWNPIHWVMAHLSNSNLEKFLEFFLEAGKPMDFIGLTYYSHIYADGSALGMPFRSGDLRFESGYSPYPEGFYRALKKVDCLGVPVIVVENGIGDSRDVYRDIFLKRYLYAMHQAMTEGVMIEGYYYRSLIDCDFGNGEFGLYECDKKTKMVKWRRGSNFFKEVVNKFNKLEADL
jgi:beta-glucosidase